MSLNVVEAGNSGGGAEGCPRSVSANAEGAARSIARSARAPSVDESSGANTSFDRGAERTPRGDALHHHMDGAAISSREALQWLVGNFQLYQGSTRGLFLADFWEEHEPGLEAAVVDLKARGVNLFVVKGEAIAQQAEYLFDLASTRSSFGRALASKMEMDLHGADLVIIQDALAPENSQQLWYLHNYLIYPRLFSGRTTIITTQISYDEFMRHGATCPDADFGGRSVGWEKLRFLMESSLISLDSFKKAREDGLPPMLNAEYCLWKALSEQGFNVVPQHVVGDYMLDLALIEGRGHIDIECDGISTLGGHRQSLESKRDSQLLSNNWQILRFSTAEIMHNLQDCVESVREVLYEGRKKNLLGRLVGKPVPALSSLPEDDEVQYAAITHGGGPAAIAGAAGTGKTTCLVQRTAHLINSGISPERILVLSHGEKTLNSIKQKLEAELEKPVFQRLPLYTWHELGIKILKENLPAVKRKAPLKIESNSRKIIERLLKKHKKDLDSLTLELATGLDEFTVAEVISAYKSGLVTPAQVKEKAKDQVEELIARVYQAYEEHLQKSNRVDIEDVTSLTAQMLLDHRELYLQYQSNYDYVLIDDYQDVTAAEDMLARVLSAPCDNLFLAGDEDEAIWENKGASSKFFLGMSAYFPQARCYFLEKSWRSTPAIIAHAQQLASHLSKHSYSKELVSAPPEVATSGIVGPQQLETEAKEAEWVAEEIALLIDSGRNLNEIAVLYRYHHYGPLIEESLNKRGFCCLASRPQSELIPDEVEDMLCFLKLVMDPDGPRAKEHFERVCQMKSQEVDPKLSATIASFAEANNLSYLKAVEIYSEATADQSCRELEQLVRIIRTMHQEKLPPAETISLIRRTQRLNEYYRSIKVPTEVSYEPLRKLMQLEEESRKFQSVSEFVNKQLELQETIKSAGEGGVHVLTLQESQGLEFPVVFLVGLAEGLFPPENTADLEGERRLCYVGMTRARELLYISYPSRFGEVSLTPSQFLVEAQLVPAGQSGISPPVVAGNQPETILGKPNQISMAMLGQEPVSAMLAGTKDEGAHQAVPSPTDSQAVTGRYCPSCALPLVATAKFCGGCGFCLHAKIPSCPLCTLPVEPGAKFCGECSANLIPNPPAHPTSAIPAPAHPASSQSISNQPRPDQHGWLVKFLKHLEE